jgi:hypothetical protein
MWLCTKDLFPEFWSRLKYIQQEEVLAHCYSGITLACRKHQTASHGQNSKGTVMQEQFAQPQRQSSVGILIMFLNTC